MSAAAAPGPRVRVQGSRVTGRILDWKGTYGWIQPDQPIAHPEASMRRGKVYLSQTDVEAEIDGIGTQVSFFVYADGTGLGAEGCRPHAGAGAAGAAGRAPPKTAPALQQRPTPYSRLSAPAAAGPKARTRIGAAPLHGEVKTWKGSFGWITPFEPISHPLFRGQLYVSGTDCDAPEAMEVGTQVTFLVYSDAQGLGADQCTVGEELAEGQGEEASAEAEAVAEAPVAGFGRGGGGGGAAGRERITGVQVTGEVADWKGSFGWILPHDAIDHPEATRRGGKVYVSRKDVQCAQQQLEVGQLVQFHVFLDASGLGAEECLPF